LAKPAWTFTDAGSEAGLAYVHGYTNPALNEYRHMSGGAAVGDYDGDGWLDVYAVRGTIGKNLLFRNLGDGTFEEVGEAAGVALDGVASSGPVFGDYDGDGHLDLFVCNYLDFDPAGKVPCDFFEGRPYCYLSKFKGSPPVLYRNNRDGTFMDVSAKAGIAGHSGKGLGVVAFDYNNDGRMDIFQANDSDPNFLFRNNGDGTFAEVAFEAECALDPNGAARGGMGVDADDVDGDGHQDIFVTNFSQETNAFWHNNGDGTFNETTYQLNLAKVSFPMSGFGARFFDYNNDGLSDLFVLNGHPFEPIQKVFPGTTYAEPPFLFENTGKEFREVAAERGAALKKSYLGRGLAVGDIDNDGDSDLLLMNAGEPPVLLRNDGGNRNNWLGLKLVGAKSNRDAVGAKVTVRAGAARRTKQLLGGTSYCSASDLRLLFGLGGGQKIDEVEVRWPSGGVTMLKDVAANRYLMVREDAAPPAKR
ncbi:MAG TPA: CRTAC1 family protein, partial [Pyrinomonadaceae bacterium]|nr:CRTAC1 family protein [Pyrinomonadaceae bacterium]